jgi:hypothetical protein
MNLHLTEIATKITPGAQGRAAHQSGRVAIVGPAIDPANSILIPLPAKCPKLNPQENIRQFMRDDWLSNRTFKSIDDSVYHCCDALNKLVDQS